MKSGGKRKGKGKGRGKSTKNGNSERIKARNKNTVPLNSKGNYAPLANDLIVDVRRVNTNEDGDDINPISTQSPSPGGNWNTINNVNRPDRKVTVIAGDSIVKNLHG